MYALADPESDAQATSLDPLERELEAIEHLRQRALANPEILSCSPIARHLVEREIPRLIENIRRFQRAQPGGMTEPPGAWVQTLLLDLRAQVSVVRDLIERR